MFFNKCYLAGNQIGVLIWAVLLSVCLASLATAGPGTVDVSGNTATATGDHSDGVASGVDFTSPPITTLYINNLLTDIRPDSGTAGILFRNESGASVAINSGDALNQVVIVTDGSSAPGIDADGRGTPTPYVEFLEMFFPTGPGGSSGSVQVNSYSDITTQGNSSEGIFAQSRAGGYPQVVIDWMESNQGNINSRNPYKVVTVEDSDSNVGQVVMGDNGGTFKLNSAGSYTFDLGGDFNDLAVGEERKTSVHYQVSPDSGTNVYDGVIEIKVTRTEAGLLTYAANTYFEDFGLSSQTWADTDVRPDLQNYYTTILAGTAIGGAANNVVVNSSGNIETEGAFSNGIFAHSRSGDGVKGRNGSISHSADAGQTGPDGGTILVNSSGRIATTGDYASGIAAVSEAGKGGRGGEGGTWRYGASGGAGGNGGQITVTGDGLIETTGDHSFGIFALSNGGDGGNGGCADFVTSGGGGGMGGRGGNIDIVGSWEISTEGADSHAIWGKSFGGNGGWGGSGGWLGGGGGSGGSASDGGTITIDNDGSIETFGSGAIGIFGQSIGGFGGSGGDAYGWVYSFGGDARSAGSGGDVNITGREGRFITTHGQYAHAIMAQSIGGGGGNGGSAGAIVALGGEGGAGGHGGTVRVTNASAIQTLGYKARGIYAQSIGGGGGDGGDSGDLVAIGGSGSGTSNGGAVYVTNSGTIITGGLKSNAIFAESVGGGGGDGGDSGGLVAIGGAGGDGGYGGTVDVFNSGRLATDQNESSAIFAQSVGGGGGNGGDSVGIGLALATVAIGGSGGKGGYSDTVNIINSSDSNIITGGDRSSGIFAQSVGGGGGNGGFAVTVGTPLSVVNLGIGGRGGGGGDGNEVEVHSEGTIITLGEEAHGILAQSVGGGGGSGGFAVSGNLGGGVSLQLALGGKGGLGGMGRAVTVGTDLNPLDGTINTFGNRSYGVLAQSVGGGGGDGGFSIAGSGLTGTSLQLAIGGDGGGGGKGGAVNVNSMSNISTQGDDAHAIVAQSIGGGGGNGGFSLAASYGGGTGLNFGFGGKGGTGNEGGAVKVGSTLNPLGGNIITSGDRAYGVMAQSIGGGGGNGGSSITGQLLGGQTVAFSFGGDGGSGGLGGAVDVESDSNILTQGEQSHGVFAQSVGGGGGNGGLSIGAAVTAFGGLNFSMGGDGGNGNSGGAVDVNNIGIIETINEHSHGIMAQSIGGGGGMGGSSGSVMVNFSSLIPVPPEIPITGSANFSISVGGDGGIGGQAGSVNVDNAGSIATYDDFSVGIYTQSIGGGGGDGGKSVAATANISLPEDPSGGGEGGAKPQMEVKVDFALAIGGDGGNGNSGGRVDVINSGTIDTFGDSSHGIYAQSVGGGGGIGGDARSMTLSIDPSNWLPSGPPPSLDSFSQALNISIGGNAGSGNNGGIVTVANKGDVITRGADAYGIFAQSIGGGGGQGGGGYHGLDWEDLGVPEDIAPFLDLAPIEENSNIQIVVGGQGGSSGNGSDVNVANEGDIITLGNGSIAVLAQSIGGGGGTGGVGAHGSGTVGIGGSGGAAGNGGNVNIDISGNIDTSGVAADGIFAQSIGGGGGIAGNVDGGVDSFGISLNFGVGQNGGNAGNGGEVTVTSAGNITTRGAGSNGIFVQSIGGGGGLVGDVSTGLGFAGSVGGNGSGGDITIKHNGNITTFGDNSHGIFAQSAGGQNDSVSQQLGLMDVFGNLLRDPSGGIVFGPLIALSDSPDLGGELDITVTGNVMVHGAGSYGIFAQSTGNDGSGDISVTISGGTVQGGSGSGAGIYIDGGADNVLANSGSISALSGTAIVGGGGNDTIDNYGTVTGDVNIGAGNNAFNNFSNAIFNAGSVAYLGSNRLLTNAGALSPGDSETVLTTALTGNIIQTSSGVFSVNLDLDAEQADRLNVSGTSDFDGLVSINVLNPGWAKPGTEQMTIISSAGGVTDSGLGLDFRPSAVIDYELIWPNETDVELQTSIDFSPEGDGLSYNHKSIGDAVNRIQLAGGSEEFAPFVAELFNLPDAESLGDAYDQLSPESYGALTTTTFDVTQQYTQALAKRMHSVRSYMDATGGTPAVRQTLQNSAWVDGFGQVADQDAGDGFTGFKYSLSGAAAGLDYLVYDDLIVGVSFGQSHTTIDFDNNRGHGDVESSFGSIYGSLFDDHAYLDTALSYGRQSYKNRRLVEVGSLAGVARSSHNSDSYSAYAETGYNLAVRKWLLQPFASLQYAYLDEEGYRESGISGINLIVDDRKIESLVSDLGMRFIRPFELGLWKCVPDVTVAWRHDYDIDGLLTTAAFDGSPSTAFTTESSGVDKDGIVIGGGVTLLKQSGVSMYFRYDSEMRGKYDSQRMSGGFRCEF